MQWQLEHDVVLLGAGPGALCAAITLAERGLKPLIVEKSGLVGGASAYSGGIVWAPNNHRMKAKKLADSREDAMAYLEAVALGRGDRAVAAAYVDAVARVVERLQSRTALRWVTYPDLPDYYAEIAGGKAAGRFLLPHGELVRPALEAAAKRWPQMAHVRPCVHLRGQENDWVWGRALVGCLWARVLEDRTPFLLEHRGISLVRSAQGIEGVVLSGPRGTVNVRARWGVLLNTGGFEWNDALTRLHVPGRHLHPQTPPGNEGDGHMMAAEIGAAMGLLDQTIAMPSVCIPGETNADRQLYRIFFQELALPHSLLVNAHGRRFANESYFVDIARGWTALTADCTSPNLPCFFVFDDEYRSRYGFPVGLSPQLGLRQHASLDELGAALGIDAGGLRVEIRNFNAMIEDGRPDAFGRGLTAYQRAFGDKTSRGNPTLGRVGTPPFYGIEIHPATSSHRGGVLIDGHGRVLDVHGNVIPGLFACGCCAAGTLTGGSYFSGAAVGHSLVFGTLAAEKMMADATARTE